MAEPSERPFVAQETLVSGSALLDSVGTAVALSNLGNVAFIGTPGKNRLKVMAKSLCSKSDEPGSEVCWIEIQSLDGGALRSDAQFGGVLSLSGDGTVGLSTAAGDSARAILAGSAFIFQSSDGGMWRRVIQLVTDSQPNDLFGFAAELSDDGGSAVVGAPGADSGRLTDCGKAYLFSSAGGSWEQVAELVADDASNGDRFGSAVAITADTIFVGAKDSQSGNGAVHVYELQGNATHPEWPFKQTLPFSNPWANPAGFGNAIATAGTGLVFVGARACPLSLLFLLSCCRLIEKMDLLRTAWVLIDSPLLQVPTKWMPAIREPMLALC